MYRNQPRICHTFPIALNSSPASGHPHIKPPIPRPVRQLVVRGYGETELTETSYTRCVSPTLGLPPVLFPWLTPRTLSLILRGGVNVCIYVPLSG